MSASHDSPLLRALDRYAAFTDLSALKEASLKPLRKSKRINTLKTNADAFLSWAKERGWQLEPVPWCNEGYFIDREDREVALGKDLLHLLGHTYMQEAASMLPVELLDPQPGETVLDMSAAPGSKTTQIAAKMQGKGVIIANDVQEKRLWTLKAALHRCGASNVIVTKKVGQWFARQMTERFDRVLCDAPCTAQGTVRKDSDALLYSSLENVGKMARLQRELLEAAVDAAKVGGTVVYSTCTLSPEENEAVVGSVLEKYRGRLEVVDPHERMHHAEWKMEQAIENSLRVQQAVAKEQNSPLSIINSPLIRLWPQTFDTEGFFVAALRKTAPTRAAEPLDAVRFQEERLPRSRQKQVGEHFADKYGTTFLREGDRLFERASQVILSTEEVSEFRLPVQNYALGIPFARRIEENRFRIDHDTATLRGGDATMNVLDADDALLALLLDGKDGACDPQFRGDVLLRYRDMIIGTSLAKEGKLFNRLPRWIVLKS
ncbi:MAG: NOL1/NOP2/sun family putative RNA methylase [Candidatus Peribacteraceae bacterium]|nr:NOL1/NOP2/sun family putative RNA methylase [Candidatus Peribacteraceae bacterium]